MKAPKVKRGGANQRLTRNAPKGWRWGVTQRSRPTRAGRPSRAEQEPPPPTERPQQPPDPPTPSVTATQANPKKARRSPFSLVVRTSLFQGESTGSIPVRDRSRPSLARTPTPWTPTLSQNPVSAKLRGRTKERSESQGHQRRPPLGRGGWGRRGAGTPLRPLRAPRSCPSRGLGGKPTRVGSPAEGVGPRLCCWDWAKVAQQQLRQEGNAV